MTLQEARQLLKDDVQQVIIAHRDDDPEEFALSFKNVTDFPKRAIAEQIACLSKARKKLPELCDNSLLFHPVALQQCTSSALAKLKPKLLNMRGKKAIDLTGGLGIDTLFLAEHFEEVIYCEKDPVLIELARHNFKKLNRDNVIIHHGDSIEYLEKVPDHYFDWIYVDPSRRDGNRRYIAMEDSSPDVTIHQNLFFQKSKNTCIKFSPAMEISGISKKLNRVNRIVVFSLDSECKETVCLLRSENDVEYEPGIEAILVKTEDMAPYILKNHFIPGPRKIAPAVQAYVYEPDPAIIKSRLTESLTHESGLSFINSQTDYLTSNDWLPDFPGRKFRSVNTLIFTNRNLTGYLKEQNMTSANVARRDFPMNPSQIKDKFRLNDGGDQFLFFTKDRNGKKICIHGIKPG